MFIFSVTSFIRCTTVIRQAIILVPSILFTSGITMNAEAQSKSSPVPSAAQLAWHRMETNAFIHFTTNTFTGLEWGNGDESEKIFNPSALDAEQWARTLKAAGFKTLILTCKHHDGFCLWPSRYTEHSIRNSPYKNGQGDIVREVSDACKKYGLNFGVYLSPWDRNNKDYGKPAYIEYYRNQLRELFTNYGKITEMWFDGANGGSGYYGGAKETRKINGATYYDWPGTLRMIRGLQPAVLFFSDAGPDLRWVGNERGQAGETNWNTISPDTLYAGKPGIETLLNTGSPDGNRWIPAEVDVSIRPGWFYHAAEDGLVKTPAQLFAIYLSSVGRGSTLLLNVPPDQRGLLNERDVASLVGFKKMRDSIFSVDLAAVAAITHVKDEMTIRFKKAGVVHYILLQEDITAGQRVSNFAVDALVNSQWMVVAQATTIGYKRILEIPKTKTDQIRVRVLSSLAPPKIMTVKVY